MAPVRTYGLTHVAVAVKEPKRSSKFYAAVLGARIVYADPKFVQVQTPGTHDVFEKDAARAGKRGGVVHFGFRLHSPRDIRRAAAAITRAGGRIWYELPTPVDPT